MSSFSAARSPQITDSKLVMLVLVMHVFTPVKRICVEVPGSFKSGEYKEPTLFAVFFLGRKDGGKVVIDKNLSIVQVIVPMTMPIALLYTSKPWDRSKVHDFGQLHHTGVNWRRQKPMRTTTRPLVRRTRNRHVSLRIGRAGRCGKDAVEYRVHRKTVGKRDETLHPKEHVIGVVAENAPLHFHHGTLHAQAEAVGTVALATATTVPATLSRLGILE
ncbi:hypothetical protein BJY52DRAFT_1360919 [Lactarius psammicola]|nr:hypothetical protein BJY52DRAFT_1360919 [Lactarius psammicola]